MQRGLLVQGFVQPFVEEYFAHVPEAWRARLPLHYADTVFKKASLLTRPGSSIRPEEIKSLLEKSQHSFGVGRCLACSGTVCL